jgi:hypothetical protein
MEIPVLFRVLLNTDCILFFVEGRTVVGLTVVDIPFVAKILSNFVMTVVALVDLITISTSGNRE